MIRIVLTRSYEENQILKDRLNQILNQPHEILELNLIEYKNINYDFNQLKFYENVIVTSKYTAKLLKKFFHQKINYIDWAQNLKFWVVGGVSTEILSSARLNVIESADNISKLMINMKYLNPQESIYLSGNIITQELNPLICREIIYNVNYVSSLNKYQIDFLKKNIDFILIYSLKNAEVFISLLKKYELLDNLQIAKFITLSKKIMNFFHKYITNISYNKDIIHELNRQIND